MPSEQPLILKKLLVAEIARVQNVRHEKAFSEFLRIRLRRLRVTGLAEFRGLVVAKPAGLNPREYGYFKMTKASELVFPTGLRV